MALQHDLKMSRPFDVKEEEAFINIQRTAAELEADLAHFFREHGITGHQYNVLRILRGAGPQGLPSLEIARRMVTRVPDITRLIDRLERSEWATRLRCTADRRVTWITLTDQGAALCDALAEPLRQWHRQRLSHMDPEEIAELNRLMVKTRSKG